MAFKRWKRPERNDTNSRNFMNVLFNPCKPIVDIIAVHGLNPLDTESHAEATWTAGDKLWLRDFLPNQVPKARILLFGYNANVAFQTAAAGIREQAENLLNQLNIHRTEDPSRPLIFICHSLGGIVVKRALVHSKADQTYETIVKSTFGIAFLATPHRGGNHAGIGEVVAKVARSMLGNPNNTFMRALKKDSQFLDTISDDFRQLLEDFQILSFYETQPLCYFGIVVDRKSAVLGLPGTREKQLALEADHRSICKFSSDKDPNYQLVAENIIRMINTACSLRNRSNSSKLCSGENESACQGHLNSTFQAGNGNTNQVVGHANKTRQFGNQNTSISNGNGNETIQISSGALEIGPYVEMLKRLDWLSL
ncbi:hypothetical protein F4806DRAFT_494425 [Annulohypoxylon nitens]|nr:hypothetical protein F4806DRAFT_494425 [Annulohypoxylon nitens]